MAITTLDGALAGMQAPRDFTKVATPTLVAGRPHSLWYLAGTPGAGSAPTANLKGQAFSAPQAGQIPFTDPGAGNTYLAALEAAMTVAGGEVILCDRLWGNGNIVLTSGTNNLVGNPIVSSSVANPTMITCTGNVSFANSDVVTIRGHSGSTPSIDGTYTISNVSGATFTIPVNVSSGGTGGTVGIGLPARDDTGTASGVGVLAALEVSSAMGANAPTMTLTYTNQAGVGGRTATNIDAAVASAAAGAFHRFALQAGDTGIQTIQTFAFGGTAWASGTANLILYRVLARLPLIGSYIPAAKDMFALGMQRIYNGSVPFLVVLPASTTASVVSGNVIWTQG